MLIESAHGPAAQATPDPSIRLRSAGAAAWFLVGMAVLFIVAAALLMVGWRVRPSRRRPRHPRGRAG